VVDEPLLLDEIGTIPVLFDGVFCVLRGDDLSGLRLEVGERIRELSPRTLRTVPEREARLVRDGLSELLRHDDGKAESFRNLEGALPVPAVEMEILVALLSGATFLLEDDWREEKVDEVEEEVIQLLVLLAVVAIVTGVGELRMYLLGGLFWTIALHSRHMAKSRWDLKMTICLHVGHVIELGIIAD